MGATHNPALSDGDWFPQSCIQDSAQQHETDIDLSASETILVVEDEVYIRDVIRDALVAYGYDVLCATDAEEGIRVFDQHDGPIHVLLTDVMMPGMNGRELAQHLAKRSPSLKTIFMSGYADNVIVQNCFRNSSPTVYLHKPFSLDTLANKIREVISSTAGEWVRPDRIN